MATQDALCRDDPSHPFVQISFKIYFDVFAPKCRQNFVIDFLSVHAYPAKNARLSVRARRPRATLSQGVNVISSRHILTFPLLLLFAACVDEPTGTGAEPRPEPEPAQRVLGVFEVTITGMAGPQMNVSVQAVPAGPSQAVSAAPTTGIIIETLSAARMTHGVRGQGGERYITATTLVRNATGAPLQNLTLIPVAGTTTIPGTAFRTVTLYDGTAAPTSLVEKIVPAGAVAITDDGGLRAAQVDVLQVFDPAELSGITLAAPDTSLLPYGFIVRNRFSASSRTLDSTTDPDELTGVVTFSFRHPLPATSAGDPNTYTFRLLAVEDSETRMTESIEEGQDSSAVRQIHERAAALGATTVTVLAGSPAMDPAVADYPGQRQICSVRASGPTSAPTAYITDPSAYARVVVLRPGESVDPCAAHFRTGTPGRPTTGIPFSLTLTAMDLYGNVITTAADSVRLEAVSGPAVTLGPRAALVSGQATIQATYADYGESRLRAVGRRNRGAQALTVGGITRTWTGSVSTDWVDGGNWDVGVAPGAQDTAVIPTGRPNYPVLPASDTVGGVTMDDGTTLDLGAFDLTVGNDVLAGLTGGISSTTGTLHLTGITKLLQGNLPPMRVTGTYSLSGPVTARARVRVDGGRLRASGFRLRTTSF